MENIYEENGYDNRNNYLESLAEDYDIPEQEVYCLAELLGESEDFDGLVSALEDYQYYM